MVTFDSRSIPANKPLPPLAPSGIGSHIVYEDHLLLVIDKPANLLVHPTGPGRPETLWDELKRLLAFEIVNGAQISLINRLDRETSGLVLVAKSSECARQLGLMMTRHRIQKIYTAIIFGWPAEDAFTVNQPLLRQGTVQPSRIWLKQMVHPDGAPAKTAFEVTQRFSVREHQLALVTARPKTGRTHQIRVHLAYIGHSIVGDKIYGPDENCYLKFIASGWTPELEEKLLLSRQALHASGLCFEYGGRKFDLRSDLPPDMRVFFGHSEELRRA
jgi:23S rRNA pseudouridine1911/1915/1917 synthase